MRNVSNIVSLLEKDQQEIPKNPVKKNLHVSWNDGQSHWDDEQSEQVSGEFIQQGTAGSSNKSTIDEEVCKLITDGYSEIEALSIAGKSISRQGEYIYSNPVFYETKEIIDARKALELEEDKSREPLQLNKITGPRKRTNRLNMLENTLSHQENDDRNLFFSTGVGLVAAVAIGVVLALSGKPRL